MESKKNVYVTPRVIAVSVDTGNLLETVSFNPNEKGELDAKRMNLYDLDDSDDETSY